MNIRTATSDDMPSVTRLLDLRAAADGRPALSEHKALRKGRPGVAELVAEIDGALVGYGQAAHHPTSDPDDAGQWEIEVAIDPTLEPAAADDAATELVAGLMGRAGDADVALWAWRPGDVAAAHRLGLTRRRVLLEMRRPLPVDLEATWPDGVSWGTFSPGHDDHRLIAANNDAFAGHPENGAMDHEDLMLRMGQAWFDPSGFLLAYRGGEVVGFCWTKLHLGGVGEIYIIGVVAAAQGIGLGRCLVLAGLDDLAMRQGADEAMLYTDGDDSRAVGLYESLGFEKTFVNQVFGADPSLSGQPNR